MRSLPGPRRAPGLAAALLLLLLAPPLPSRAPEEERKERGAAGDFLPSVCTSCHADATCQQQDGKYACICNYGFVGNGRTHCQDKDECQIGTSEICGEHASCHNTHGSFYCICLEGYKASNNNSVFIPNDGTHCVDIDECEASDICGLGGLCVNIVGSYKCSCAEGYRTKNGAKTFHPPTDRISCEVLDCGIPPSFPNTSLALVNKTTYGNKVEYTCLPGYSIESGNWTSVCNSKGRWEGSNLVCKEIGCGEPLQLPNTDIVWDNTMTLGSIAYYKCKKGFQSVGERNFSQCTVSRKWENITFECKAVEYGLYGGLKEPGVDEVTTWPPTSSKDCGHPPLIPNSEVKWDKTSRLGSVVEYKCSKGFYASNPKTFSHCTHNGSWEILDLTCKKMLPFIDFEVNDSCLTWRRNYGSEGVNETYRLTMRVLGSESKKTASDVKINLTTAEEAVKMCLPFEPHTNYSIKIEVDSSNLVSRFSLLNPVTAVESRPYGGLKEPGVGEVTTMPPASSKEKPAVFGNISTFNVTCIKWQRKLGRTLSEKTYVLRVRGHRWYQKEFLHSVTLDFAENSGTPALCLNLHPGSNYTVNISTANLDHNVTVYITTPITDPQSPEVEFISGEGSSPVFTLRKAEETNGPISSYQVIVVPWSPRCNFNCYSLTTLTYFSNGVDSDGYVAAEFPAKFLPDNGSVFALGDRCYYGKFYNAPLKPGKDYCIILMTISEWDEVRRQSCIPWAQIKGSSSGSEPSGKKSTCRKCLEK
ncbi:sushi domain-containing protein 1 isoform X2 [Sphaerodactylus townsendi]|uniref:sushi domain-containing protein 1 isoform X2 n=1 Tax=Sphaerodactylus townsendi TaxID=933632 RepID=UPI0020261B8E|nr:sushi domain-containing protein 1 isoform X2 [Sphaerodactylus townsendi]